MDADLVKLLRSVLGQDSSLTHHPTLIDVAFATNEFKCSLCKQRFGSLRGRQQHQTAKHFATARLPPLNEHNIVEYCRSAEPSEQEQEQLNALAGQIIPILTSIPLVTKVVQGGSSRKHTAVKGHFDLDLVVFFRDFNGTKACMKRCKRLLTDHIKHSLAVEWLPNSPTAVRFKKSNIEVEVLSTGELPKGVVPSYDDPSTRLFMATQVEPQVSFADERAPSGSVQHEVILGIKKFVKKWDVLRPVSSYLIETLVIHLAGKTGGMTLKKWKKLSRNEQIKILFVQTLKMLVSLGDLRIGEPAPASSSQDDVPYVGEPINPENNLLARVNPDGVTLMVLAALATLGQQEDH
eukprot:c10182_g1_i1.p1 GENE.c10182_g1_i1~~c10182_g1_i1.p1  ORF type:complete len:350 (-),score=70.22 c10182_g1_i1:808-1857(-)